MQHVIWDWNGTLLNDIEVVVAAVNDTIGAFGAPELSVDGYQQTFTRPVAKFYERLLGRPVEQHEWRTIDDTFHDAYEARLADASLAVGAREVLDALAAEGTSQSLLSMAPHDHVLSCMSLYDIGHYMVRVDGLRDGSGALEGNVDERSPPGATCRSQCTG